LNQFSDHPVKSAVLGFMILAAMLIGLPLIGVGAAGIAFRQFLEFPPLTRYVAHAGFSWSIFILIGIVDLVLFVFLASALLHGIRKGEKKIKPAVLSPYPWWGWAGVAMCLCGWIMAWSRFDGFEPFQRHTFVLLWFGYIIIVNAECFRRSSKCPITEFPIRFWLLFPLSSIFWWFFEYLNRFVQNWYYLGVEGFDPMGYVFFASLSFSTVLPAVFSTYKLLLTIRPLDSRLSSNRPFKVSKQRFIAISTLLLSGAGLSLIGVFPDILFPLIWVSPLLIITALQSVFGKKHIFSSLARGDWRKIVMGPIAALICGFFWEMWNINNLAKWEYAIPFVDRFGVFEMPILGYGGYLPFGLACLMICQIVFGSDQSKGI